MLAYWLRTVKRHLVLKRCDVKIFFLKHQIQIWDFISSKTKIPLADFGLGTGSHLSS